MLRKDGEKHVVLVISSPAEEATSKFSESAIAEGNDILNDALNMSGVGDLLNQSDTESPSTYFQPQLARVIALQHGSALPAMDDISPAPPQTSPPRPLNSHLDKHTPPIRARITHHVSPQPRPVSLDSMVVYTDTSHHVGLQTNAANNTRHASLDDRRYVTVAGISHVPVQPGKRSLSTGRHISHEARSPEHAPEDSRRVCIADKSHVAVEERRHVYLHGRRTNAGSNASAWLPSE